MRLQDEGKVEGARAVIEQMEKTLPAAYHEFDATLKTDLSNLHLMLGDTAKYRDLADELEPWYLQKLAEDPTGQNMLRSPFFFLLEYYDVTEQWEKGIGILRQAEQFYPGDPSIAERIRLFQSYIDNGGKRIAIPRDTVMAGQ